MLFHITQTHTPDKCPKDVGGASTLYNKDTPGVKVKGFYGAYTNHTIYYIVEAGSMEAVEKFLDPGMLRCTATVTPVSTIVREK